MHGIYKARDVHVYLARLGLPLVCWFGIVQCPTRQLYTCMYGLWLLSRDSVARHKQNKNNSCIRLDNKFDDYNGYVYRTSKLTFNSTE